MSPCLLLLLILPTLAAAEEAIDILRGAAESYRAARSFEIAGTISSTLPNKHRSIASVQFVRAGPEFLPPDSPVPVVSGQIIGKDPRWLDEGGKTVATLAPLGDYPPIGELTNLAVDVESVTQSPDDSVDLEGQTVACHVLDVVYRRGTYRLWIDQNRHWILRMRVRDWTVAITSIKFNQPPPEWLLDPRLLLKFAGRELPAWAGRPAPGFELGSLDGKAVSLAGLRGKVVLLNFWATWCGPCEGEMPLIEHLRQELAPQGVEVWGVTDEPADTARQWLEKYGRSLPTLIDTSRNLFKQYEVKQIPVLVVIGRDGKVVSYSVGLRGEADIRADLRKAIEQN